MKTTIARHWEKAALAASAALLIGVVVADRVAAPADRAGDAVSAEVRKLETALASRPAPAAPRFDRRSRVEAAFMPVASVAAGGDWMFYKPTLIVVTPGRDPKPRSPEPVFLPPALQGAKVEPGKVTLTWLANPANNVPSARYVVLRKGPGDKDWVRVATLPGGVTTWTDEAVRPRKAYQYAVAAAADPMDAMARAAVAKGLAAANGEGRPGNALAVVAAREIRLRVEGGSLAADNAAVNVTLSVFRDGEWKSKLYPAVHKGDRVGAGMGLSLEVLDIVPVRVQVPTRVGRAGTLTETRAKFVFRNEDGEPEARIDRLGDEPASVK